MVADALSHKVRMAGLMIKTLHLLEEISVWNPRLEQRKVIFGNIVMRSTLLDHIKEAQKKDLKVQKWLVKVQNGEMLDFNLGSNRVLRFRNRIVMPKDDGL